MSKLIYLLILNVIRAISVDCPNVISLAQGLNMSVSNPLIWNSLNLNCCSTSEVTCSSGRVTAIDWKSLSLDGFINASSIPNSLTRLELGNNTITGAFPNISSLTSITYLDLSSNKFYSGNMPDLAPLAAATYVDLSSIQLTGCISLLLNTNLVILYLIDNNLTGPIPPLPPSLKTLEVQGNKLSGYFPSPHNLNRLILDHSTYHGNSISGTISIATPTYLFIASQNIWDLTISDVNSLAECSIGYNPLLGNPLIATLTKTNFDLRGLYSSTAGISKPYTFRCDTTASLNIPLTSKTTTAKVTTNVLTSFPTSSIISLMRTSNNYPLTSTVPVLTKHAQVTTTKQFNLFDVFTTELRSNLETTSATAMPSPAGITPVDGTMMVVFMAAGAFAVVCILILIAGKVFKNPTVHSKFARKSSYGTLQTMQSKNK